MDRITQIITNLTQEYTILAKYEDALSLTDDPKKEIIYQKNIEECKSKIANWKSELAELKKNPVDLSIPNNTSLSSTKIIFITVGVIIVAVIAFVILNKFVFNNNDNKIEITDSNNIISVDTQKLITKDTSTVDNQINNNTNNNVVQTKLSIDVWTNKGKNPVFKNGEDVQILFKTNKVCYIRLIYKMADGSAILLADNVKVSENNVNKTMSAPYNFICSEPFGSELLSAYAQSEPFEKLKIRNQDGYDFIDQPLSDAYGLTEKGLKKKIEFQKIQISITTTEN